MSQRPRMMVLSSVLDERPRLVELDRPMSVAEAIALQKVRLELPTIAVMSGLGEPRPILRGEWHVRMVRPGETLAFVPVPGREGLGSILAAIAGVALAIFAPWAAGFVVGAMGLTGTAATIATSLISMGIVIAGQFIINRLLPAPARESGAEAIYTARASSNRAMPGETIPSLYGRLRYPPPYAARPYAEFVDNDQYLYQLHCMGVGHVAVERWEIGDTLVWTADSGFTAGFSEDTEIEIVEPGADVTLFPANVTTSGEVDGQTVPDEPAVLGPFAANPSGTKISRIMVDYVFPFGLGRVDSRGRQQNWSRTVKAEYRLIDDAGTPLGTWTQLFEQPHTGRSRTPLRFSRGGTVPAGRYEVLLSADDKDWTDWTGNEAYMNRVAWAGLRGYLEDFETPPGVTLVATRIRASEHLAQNAAGRYFFTGTRKLPVWNGSTWSAPVATRSIAWAAADLLRNADYGLGLSPGEFDLAWLAAYAAIWEARGDRFDAVFDRRWPAGQALDAILRAGRAYHVRLGSALGFVRDEPRQLKRMAFTADTIVKGSYQREDIWFSEESPDHLEVTYLDGESWRDRSVICAIGAIGQDRPQEAPLFGITDHDHAWREGIFMAAENAYRRSFRTFQVEREGRMLVRGDAVVLSDPIHDFAGHARVAGRSGDTLTLDRVFEPEAGETYLIALRDKRGREWGPCLVSNFDGANVLLDASARAAVVAVHGSLESILPNPAHQETAHATLLKEGHSRFNGLVLEARPVGTELWEVALVNDDPRVYEADQTEIKPSPWTPPPSLPPVPEQPVIEGLTAYVARSTWEMFLEAGWLPAPGADRYEAQISYDEDADDNPDEADWTPIHDSKATRLSVAVSPQQVTLRVAGIGAKRGLWTYAVITDLPKVRVPVDPEDDFWRKVIDIEHLKETVTDLYRWTGEGARERADELRQLALAVAELSADDALERDILRRQVSADVEGVRAFAQETILVAVGPGSAIALKLLELEAEIDDKASASALQALVAQVEEVDGEVTALAEALTLLNAEVDDVSASLTIRGQAQASPGSGYVRWGVVGKLTTDSWASQAAIFLDVHSSQPSRIMLSAGQTFILDSLGNPLALFDEQSGTVYLENVRMKFAQIDDVVINWANIESAVINNLTVTDGMIPASLINDSDDGSFSGNTPGVNSTPWVDVPGTAITLNSPSSHPSMIFWSYTLSHLASDTVFRLTEIRLVRGSTVIAGPFSINSNAAMGQQTISGSQLVMVSDAATSSVYKWQSRTSNYSQPFINNTLQCSIIGQRARY